MFSFSNSLTIEQFMQVFSKEDSPTKKSFETVIDVTHVLKWLEDLGLSRYAEVFIKEEIDWDSLQWLTEEVLYCFPNSWLFFFPQFISHCNILLSLMFLDFVTPYYLGTLSYLISQHAKGINTECRV